MSLADDAQDKIVEALNADGRSTGHLALGAALCLGLIAATSAIAASRPQPVAPGAEPSRKPMVRAIWPAVFSVSTLASLRVWNAPASPTRTRALGLWMVLQGSNALLMWLRPSSTLGQTAAAMATAGLTTAYARVAADVDEKAAQLVAPTGFAGLASLAATPSS